MQIKLIAALTIALSFAASPASAQMFDRNATHIQVNYLVQLPGHSESLDDQKTAIASAHTIVYDLASRECAAMQAAFGSDCRLINLNVGTGMPQFGMQNAGAVSMSANATFELTPTSAPKPVSATKP